MRAARHSCTASARIANTVFMGDRIGPRLMPSSAISTAASGRARMLPAGRASRIRREIRRRRALRPVQLLPVSTARSRSASASRGQRGRDSAIAGAFDMDGDVAVNPSGGTLCTNPIGVTGLVRHIDAARRSWAAPAPCRFLTCTERCATAVGGSAQFFTVTVLGADPLSVRRMQMATSTSDGQHRRHPGRMARPLQLFGRQSRRPLFRGSQGPQDPCHPLQRNRASPICRRAPIASALSNLRRMGRGGPGRSHRSGHHRDRAI